MPMAIQILWFIGGMAALIIMVAAASSLVYYLIDKVRANRGSRT